MQILYFSFQNDNLVTCINYTFKFCIYCIITLAILFPQVTISQEPEIGLAIEDPYTQRSHLTYNGEPLLAFGSHLEHILFEDYDYEKWTAWAVEHGINHCRTRLYHAYYRKYSPFLQTEDGRYDLTRWNTEYWERFHRIMSHLEANDIIVHLLIFPQGTGGYWWQGDKYYLPEYNVHPKTEFIRPKKSTAGFWQSLAKGKEALYEIQTAILWKLIEESAQYDNIYYDLCHEPFIHAMNEDARQDMRFFLEETTRRFVEKYQEYRPGKIPVLGIDTDFTPPGPMRDWIYNHDLFNLMIQGQNHNEFYSTTSEAIALGKTFAKPFCPQESLDPPGIVHIPGIKHDNSLTLFDPKMRPHLRKYVWRWIMAKSQLIDIYQKGLRNNIEEPDRYEPYGHNEFEKDALIIRKFWEQLIDYPHLDFRGTVEAGPGSVQMVLSSTSESIVYLSSPVGLHDITYEEQPMQLQGLHLEDGDYAAEIWKVSAPGGVVGQANCTVTDGRTLLELPQFIDDIIVYITK